MAEWSKNKVESSAINGGKEFTTDDVLAINELNTMVNNSFYAVDFVEAMADAPDVSDIDGTGTPSVSLVSNIKNGKVFKKFKFSNLRGEKGLQGDKGDTGDKGEKGDKGDPNTLTIGSVSSGETASATITGTAPNQVLNLVLPKGEKGDKGDTGNISSLDTSLSLTSTNAVQNKVITQKFNDLEDELLVTETISYSNLYSFLTNNFDNVIKIKINTSNTSMSISSTIVTLSSNISSTTSSILVSLKNAYVFSPVYLYNYPAFWFCGGDNNYRMKLSVATGGISLYADGIRLDSGVMKVEVGSDIIPSATTFDVTYIKA
jgi:hypothetical protein